MKKIILPILLLTSFYSFAFDYHGIKSGMSEEEVKALTGCSSASSCSEDEVGTDEVFNTSLGISPPDLWKVNFAYTSDKKLWRISLYFYENSGASGVAQKKALNLLYECCQNDSEKIGSGAYSFNVNLLVAQLIDERLFTQDVNNIYKEKIDLY